MMAEDDFPFMLRYEVGDDWAAYLEVLDQCRRGIKVPYDWVESTFLVAEADGEIVGRASIRHELGNGFLASEGGHIGYGVVPGHRRRGYATEILRQSLIIARSHGVDRVLITCDEPNVASARVIERCGGVYESTVPGSRDPLPKRRYWID